MALSVQDNVIFRIQLNIDRKVENEEINFNVNALEACTESLLIRDSDISSIQGTQNIKQLDLTQYPEIAECIAQITPLVVAAIQTEPEQQDDDVQDESLS